MTLLKELEKKSKNMALETCSSKSFGREVKGVVNIKWIKMDNIFKNNGSVSICHKNNCIHASGENARLITVAACMMLLFIGVAALVND